MTAHPFVALKGIAKRWNGLLGVDISVISAATLMSVSPLLIAFLVFQRQFVRAFLRAGIK